MIKTLILFLAFAVSGIATAQTPSELKSELPQMSGWEIDQAVETFGPDNLFERINGAAPGYFLFGFKELTVFVYNQKNGGDDAAYITMQIYRHATNDDAFGIYASERPSESGFFPVGAEGYQEGTMLNFFIDCLYVKIESPSTSDDVAKAVRQIAQGFANSINPQAAFPLKLQWLPAADKLPHTEQYIPTGFLGHEFFNKAFTATYQSSGKKYQIFIIDAGTVDHAKTMLTKYYQFTKQTSRLSEGRLTIKDRYNGDLECQWKGQYIWGVINDGKASLKIDNILKEIGKKLQ